jgi:hypothetical protein
MPARFVDAVRAGGVDRVGVAEGVSTIGVRVGDGVNVAVIVPVEVGDGVRVGVSVHVGDR